MDWNQYLSDSGRAISAFRKAQPETAKGFTALHHSAMADSALDEKTKEFIALSIGISKQCLDCIGFHMKALIKLGATRDEVSAAISVAVLMGGGPSMMYGAKALEAFDQLSG